ncbi:phage recombination protein Bet [Olsenella phocaeensis]|uniref:phage recombination protein Bet n=1 Tax=Olsenella phocaeensis TaxID=1852385 RepID=UPI000930AA1C|nr:phage recombination protein Bet [Olsenella phocaeensis]
MPDAIVKYTASDGSEVKLSPAIVQQYIVTGGQQADPREVFSFMAKCQARHLNPLAGDAYMTVFKGKASVIVSKDYFVRTATQQPTFDGMRAGVVVINKETGELIYREGTIVGANTEVLVGGWAEVHDKSRSHPSRAEVSLAEYDQHHSLWNTKKATMIRKVALVQALREAYPGSYGGLYDSDEMPEPDVPVTPPVPQPVYQQPSPVEVALDPEQVAEAAEPQPQQPVPEPQAEELALEAEDIEF